MLSDTVPDWRREAEQEYRERRQVMLDRRRDALRRMEEARREVEQANQEIAELDSAARTFGIPAPEGIELERQTHIVDAAPGATLFKDVVLDVLEERWPRSMKAKEIQEVAEGRLGRAFHQKTTGMTLYRLAKSGLVRREGHQWFFIRRNEEGPKSSEPSDDLLNRA